MKTIGLTVENIDGKEVQSRTLDPNKVDYLVFKFPSDNSIRRLPVQVGNGSRKGTNRWSWNGDFDKPTIRPSVLADAQDKDRRWHCWLNDGVVNYLGDSIAPYANTKVELEDVPEWFYDGLSIV